ncbi:MAG: ATP-binding protein [Alphaproteobacteria bacterium]|nr:ATP-binding protein [Alphaproteobacteria bacterium]
MLIEFEIENYLSFRDRVSFSFEKTLIRRYPGHVLSGKIPVLSGATIYGANASGKSNLFSSMKTVVEMINGNKDISYLGFPKNKFMMRDEPTFFSFVFQSEKHIYKYSFKVSFSKITEESLHILNEQKEIKKVIFERKNGNNTNYGDELNEIEWYKYRTTTESSLLLPKLKSDGVLERKEKCTLYFKDVFSFFENFIFVAHEYNLGDQQMFYLSLQKDDFKTYLLDLLKNADLGITGIQYQSIHSDAVVPLLKMIPMPSVGKIFLRDSNRNFYYVSKNNDELVCEKLVLFHGNQQFDMQQESKGTLKLIELSLAFYLTRKIQKTVLFIDELCSSLHPKLIEFILKGTMNDLRSTKSQIILTSHDLYTLSEEFWRKDQIWFTEKEVSGNSLLTCLSSIDTRHDKSVFRSYLKGLYGGLPVLPTEAL